MVARLLFLCCLLLSLPRTGQAQGTPAVFAWQNEYGTTRDETGGLSVAVPGGYLLLGEQAYFNGTAALLYFVRINYLGDTLWTKRVGAPVSVNPHVTGFVRDATGNLLVTGLQYTANVGFVLKLDSNCVPLWSRVRQFVSPGSNFDRTSYNFPTLAPDGNYVLVERNSSTFPNGQAGTHNETVLKLDQASGAELWSIRPINSRPANFFDTRISGVVVTANGYRIFTDGSVQSAAPTPTYQYAVMQTTLNNAGVITANVVGLRNTAPFFSIATYRSPDGTTVLAGRQSLTKFTAQGDTLWHTAVPSRYPGRPWDGNAVVQDRQGNYVVAGTSLVSASGGLSINVHLARFRPTGQVVNDTMLYRTGQTYASGLLLAPSGELVVSGSGSGGPRGGTDLFAFQFRGFRPLATRAAEAAAAGLAVYPNPSGGAGAVCVTLPAAAGRGELALFDALGRAVRQQPVPPAAREAALALAGLPAGFYVLRLSAATGQSWTSKLVRE